MTQTQETLKKDTTKVAVLYTAFELGNSNCLDSTDAQVCRRNVDEIALGFLDTVSDRPVPVEQDVSDCAG